MLLFAMFVTKVVKIYVPALPCLWVSAKLILLLFVVGHSYYRVILLPEAPNYRETHSSVLGCESRPFSASIVSRYCFASFPVCVYTFLSHYLNNIIIYRQ